MDVDAGESERVEMHNAGFRSGAMARELELERQCIGGEWWGQQGQLVEGGSEGGVELR